jgi:hypothetical protein
MEMRMPSIHRTERKREANHPLSVECAQSLATEVSRDRENRCRRHIDIVVSPRLALHLLGPLKVIEAVHRTDENLLCGTGIQWRRHLFIPSSTTFATYVSFCF